jgi:hypothetical protein
LSIVPTTPADDENGDNALSGGEFSYHDDNYLQNDLEGTFHPGDEEYYEKLDPILNDIVSLCRVQKRSRLVKRVEWILSLTLEALILTAALERKQRMTCHWSRMRTI